MIIKLDEDKDEACDNKCEASKIKTVYIAGPMRNYKNYNFDAFDTVDARLTAEGYTTINPAAMDRLYEGWGQYVPDDAVIDKDFLERCMRRDLAAIFDIDAIYMLLGWEESDGAKAEHALAVCLKKMIVYETTLN